MLCLWHQAAWGNLAVVCSMGQWGLRLEASSCSISVMEENTLEAFLMCCSKVSSFCSDSAVRGPE